MKIDVRGWLAVGLCVALPAQALAFGSTSIDRKKIQKKKVGFTAEDGSLVTPSSGNKGVAPASTGASTASQTQLPPNALGGLGLLGGSGSGGSGGAPGGSGFGLGNGQSGFGNFSGGQKPASNTAATAGKQCAQGQTLVGTQCVGATGINSLANPSSGGSSGGSAGSSSGGPPAGASFSSGGPPPGLLGH